MLIEVGSEIKPMSFSQNRDCDHRCEFVKHPTRKNVWFCPECKRKLVDQRHDNTPLIWSFWVALIIVLIVAR